IWSMKKSTSAQACAEKRHTPRNTPRATTRIGERIIGVFRLTSLRGGGGGSERWWIKTRWSSEWPGTREEARRFDETSSPNTQKTPRCLLLALGRRHRHRHAGSAAGGSRESARRGKHPARSARRSLDLGCGGSGDTARRCRFPRRQQPCRHLVFRGR